jgi:hypothetical protein
MASTNGVIFPESMADILANPVDICFGSMPATSTTPAACLVIEGNAVTADQQIRIDLLKESARYGSFPRTMRLNGSILISSRDNLDGFVADWLQP